MSLEKDIESRSGGVCELCGSSNELGIYAVPPAKEKLKSNCIQVCATCNEQLENPDKIDVNHWRCLNDCMWSEVDAVKVVSYRMLNQLKAEGWPQDLLDMMYLDDETMVWAKDGIPDEDAVPHKDAFGNILQAGLS